MKLLNTKKHPKSNEIYLQNEISTLSATDKTRTNKTRILHKCTNNAPTPIVNIYKRGRKKNIDIQPDEGTSQL